MTTVYTKQQAFQLFETNRKEFLDNCRWIAERIAQKHDGYCNIDQVREQVTTPENVNPKVYGAVFNCPQFESTGQYIKTSRKTSHGRAIQVFYWKPYVNWYAAHRQEPKQYMSQSLFA